MVFEGNIKIRRKIFQALDGLTDEQFNKKPSVDRWSPKQILEHLALMETYIAAKVAKELKNPSSVRASKKVFLLAGNRVANIGLPAETCPTEHYHTIAEMKEALHNSRIYLLDVYDSSCKTMLEEKSFQHPRFGHIPLVQWFPMIGLYEKCHLKRLRKTIEELKMDNHPAVPIGGRPD